MSYIVFVDDNYHFSDDDYRYKKGIYESYEEAKEVCKNIVDDFLKNDYRQGMNAEDLYERYKFFGDAPYIIPDDGEIKFSAWKYAEQRSSEICSNGCRNKK
jgi:hypothetical protein